MNDTDTIQWERFRNSLLSQESKLKAAELETQAAADQEYKVFLKHIKRGECYICGKPLKTMSSGLPCSHWLLRPKGVKKHDVYKVLASTGYHRSAAFLRWHSNFKGFTRNINDLKNEGDPSALFHWSCTYEHRHWTFKCSRTDYQGHAGKKTAFPHYHFQMMLAGQVFIKFNDSHIPFTDEDLFWIRADLDPHSPIKQSFGPHGSGMQDAMNVDPASILYNTVRSKEGEIEKAVYNIESIISRPEGIPSETIQAAIDASTKSGETIAYHLKEMGLGPKIVISPAESIPENPDRNRTR
ncbi:MAG: hypothetical protein JW832_09435 [Deltaproteobacteria bacterium]|nr:hypothetical protein [Deltaproteobacteria bacterium]